jgi:hypothetical protein
MPKIDAIDFHPTGTVLEDVEIEINDETLLRMRGSV